MLDLINSRFFRNFVFLFFSFWIGTPTLACVDGNICADSHCPLKTQAASSAPSNKRKAKKNSTNEIQKKSRLAYLSHAAQINAPEVSGASSSIPNNGSIASILLSALEHKNTGITFFNLCNSGINPLQNGDQALNYFNSALSMKIGNGADALVGLDRVQALMSRGNLFLNRARSGVNFPQNSQSAFNDLDSALNMKGANRADILVGFDRARALMSRGSLLLDQAKLSGHSPHRLQLAFNDYNAALNMKLANGADTLVDFDRARALYYRGNIFLNLADLGRNSLQNSQLAFNDLNLALSMKLANGADALVDLDRANAFIRLGCIFFNLARSGENSHQNYQLAINNYNTALSMKLLSEADVLVGSQRAGTLMRRAIIFLELARSGVSSPQNTQLAFNDLNLTLSMKLLNGADVLVGQNRAIALMKRGSIFFNLARSGVNSHQYSQSAFNDYNSALNMKLANGIDALVGRSRAGTLMLRGNIFLDLARSGVNSLQNSQSAFNDLESALSMELANGADALGDLDRARALYYRGNVFFDRACSGENSPQNFQSAFNDYNSALSMKRANGSDALVGLDRARALYYRGDISFHLACSGENSPQNSQSAFNDYSSALSMKRANGADALVGLDRVQALMNREDVFLNLARFGLDSKMNFESSEDDYQAALSMKKEDGSDLIVGARRQNIIDKLKKILATKEKGNL